MDNKVIWTIAIVSIIIIGGVVLYIAKKQKQSKALKTNDSENALPNLVDQGINTEDSPTLDLTGILTD